MYPLPMVSVSLPPKTSFFGHVAKILVQLVPLLNQGSGFEPWNVPLLLPLLLYRCCSTVAALPLLLYRCCSTVAATGACTTLPKV
jgi:hypothetical protein